MATAPPSIPDERLQPTVGLGSIPASGAGALPAAIVLSIIVPTFQESANVSRLVQELFERLGSEGWEVVFVDDDSPDGTSDLIRSLAARHSQVRCIQRIGRRGLSSACVEGMLSSSAPFLAVMDGDMQHDPAVLTDMLKLLQTSETEIVIGSRYLAGVTHESWEGMRLAISKLATHLGRSFVPASLHDPMSGYFMLRRSLFMEIVHDLSCIGFKILLDIFASARRPVSFREIPFIFRSRGGGASKLGTLVAWEYGMLLADKLVGRYVPIRFLAFTLIGTMGLGVHLALMVILYRLAGIDFLVAQTVCTLTAMVFNYTLNNVLTYRDLRRKGRDWFTGLISFVLLCGLGAAANVGVAALLFGRSSRWLAASLAGVLIGAVWNYAVSNVYTWHGDRARGGGLESPARR